MQVSDDIFMGPALGPNPSFGTDGNPAPMSQGVGPMGRYYLFDLVPLAPATNNLAVAQAVAGAANLTLVAGAGVTSKTLPTGSVAFVLDCARCLTIVSANAGDTTQTATFAGFDYYGQPMTARVTLNGTAAVTTLKAFKVLTSVAISAATAGNISVGTTSILGFPVRVTDRGYVDAGWNNVLAPDAGTLTVADQTSPATLATGDVRGTYLPTSAADGSKRLVADIGIPGIGSGPQATRIGAYGVTQL